MAMTRRYARWLRKGGMDVFTMSPNAVIPEEGIDLLVTFLYRPIHKPDSWCNIWSAWDAGLQGVSVEMVAMVL